MQPLPPPPPAAATLPLGEMSQGRPRDGRLFFHPADGRPDTALGITWVSVPALLGGLVSTIGIPSGYAVLLLLLAVFGGIFHAVLETLGVLEPEAEEVLELEEEDIIEARFVRLGIDFEDQLPNRVVPVQATALPELSEVPTENTPTAEPLDRPETPDSANAITDILQRLDDRAELFEEINERQLVEGNPDGIEEGTETQASEGDVYRGRLYSFFRRGWTIPTTLNRDQASGLTATVQIQVGAELQIASFEIRGSSGDVVFDESVLQQLTRLQASDQRIPPPPDEVADQYIGQTIAVRFSGRQAQ